MRRLDGLLQGDYRTLFRGFGLDLADLREYQYGDDVRHIDWNVTARLQTPYVREYHEDRELTAWFLLDLSASVDFGSGEVRKRAVAADFVAVLARILTRHGNKVGALFYGEDVDSMIPARSGRRHVLRLLHAMLERPAPKRNQPTDLGALLQRRRAAHAPPLARVRGLGLHQPAGLGAAPGPARAAPRSGGGAPARSAGGQPARPRHARGAGRGDRRADLRRHARPRLSQALRRAPPRSARPACAPPSARPASTRSSFPPTIDLIDAIRRFADMRKRRSRLNSGAAQCPPTWRSSDDLHVARDALVHAGAAAAARRLPVDPAAEEETGGALRQPHHGARGDGRRAAHPPPRAAGAFLPRARRHAACRWRGRRPRSRCRHSTRP